jgi:hypothetical protein
MPQERIQVYTDQETKRMIELAAIRRSVPVTKYCLQAIKQQLVEEGLFGRKRVEIQIHPDNQTDLITNLRALQKKIMARRKGNSVEVDRVIEETHEERNEELVGLR